MGIRFVWDDSYAIGVHEVDEQHQCIFDLANALPEDPEAADVRRAIMALYKYTREHFTFEETLMLKMGYPRREEHIRLHEVLIGKLNESCQAAESEVESVIALKRLLHEWLVIHIATHDRDYARFAAQLSPAGV